MLQMMKLKLSFKKWFRCLFNILISKIEWTYKKIIVLLCVYYT